MFVNMAPFHSIFLPRMARPRKGLEADCPTQMRMFQVFHEAFHHLREALSEFLSRCMAAVKALRPDMCPLLIVRDAVIDVPVDAAGTLQGGSMGYPLDEKTLVEDECVTSPDETLEASCDESETAVGLLEWLEQDSCEVSSDEAPEAVPGKSSVSLEGPGWDSDSSWSDDEDDHDDDFENAQLWESFFRTDDPYNPLSFSSVVKSEATCPPEGSTPKARGMQPEVLCEEEQWRPLQEEMPTTRHKKVTFSEKVEVRPLVAWAFASRVARDGSCWLQMARDRDRFRRRVEAANDVIGPVLLPQHRASVWDRLQFVYEK